VRLRGKGGQSPGGRSAEAPEFQVKKLTDFRFWAVNSKKNAFGRPSSRYKGEKEGRERKGLEIVGREEREGSTV